MFSVGPIVRQPSPLFCSTPDLEYIVFPLQNIVVQTPHLDNPEGVEVSPLGNYSYSRFIKMAANSLSGNVTFSLSALEICIIPLFQLNWPRETHFRHYLFIQKLKSGINPRWPPPLHWQFTFCIIWSMTFRYRYLVPVYNFLSPLLTLQRLSHLEA